MYTVGLVQINNEFAGANYLPYSIGLLEAYFIHHSKDSSKFEFIPYIYKNEDLKDIVKKLSRCDIVGFSCYVWNINISIATATELKKLNPKIFTIFGGPQITKETKEIKCVDAICIGEGEKVFTTILDTYINDSEDEMPYSSTRISDLETIPSPYLTGVFDKIMEEADHQWLFLLETNRGCPFKCTYCNWGSATASKVNKFELDRVKAEIDWIAENKIEFIFCCDGNFGMLKRDLEIAQYLVKTKERTGFPKATSFDSAKNSTEKVYAVQSLLSAAGLNKGVNIALQTTTPSVLQAIKRDNISSESYRELQHRFSSDGILTYSDFIIGLPNETYGSFKDSVCSIIESGQCNRIQFNNLSVLPNTELSEQSYREKYNIVSTMVEQITAHTSIKKKGTYIPEYENLVTSTSTMQSDSWVATRVFCWVVSFYYFDKVLQKPIDLLNNKYGIPYADIFSVLEGVSSNYKTLKSIIDRFKHSAVNIQNGKPGMVASRTKLGIWWPIDEYVFIKLFTELVTNKEGLENFVEETTKLFTESWSHIDKNTIYNSIKLNIFLLKSPIKLGSIIIDNKLYNKLTNYSEEEWLRNVVWYQNKTGGYLCNEDEYSVELCPV